MKLDDTFFNCQHNETQQKIDAVQNNLITIWCGHTGFRPINIQSHNIMFFKSVVYLRILQIPVVSFGPG